MCCDRFGLKARLAESMKGTRILDSNYGPRATCGPSGPNKINNNMGLKKKKNLEFLFFVHISDKSSPAVHLFLNWLGWKFCPSPKLLWT